MLFRAEREGSRGPRLSTLAALAVGCALTGFGIARASLDIDRAALATREEGGSPTARGGDEHEAEATSSSGPDAPLDAPATDAGSPFDASTSASAEAAAPPVPTEAPPPSDAPARLVQGRVAYIRCEGLADTPPSGPCPRDRDVERRVWEAIDALPTSCAALVGRTGEADVRVVFDGRRVSGLGFRDVPNALDREAVRACLEPALAEVRQTVGASRMTTSFAFSLRP